MSNNEINVTADTRILCAALGLHVRVRYRDKQRVTYALSLPLESHDPELVSFVYTRYNKANAAVVLTAVADKLRNHPGVPV